MSFSFLNETGSPTFTKRRPSSWATLITLRRFCVSSLIGDCAVFGLGVSIGGSPCSSQKSSLADSLAAYLSAADSPATDSTSGKPEFA